MLSSHEENIFPLMLANVGVGLASPLLLYLPRQLEQLPPTDS